VGPGFSPDADQKQKQKAEIKALPMGDQAEAPVVLWK
jgi:hypothetical protein